MIFDDLQSFARKENLNSLEIVNISCIYSCSIMHCVFIQPKAIQLISEAFSVENDLQTPTFKIKRPAVKQKYKEVFDELYSKIPA